MDILFKCGLIVRCGRAPDRPMCLAGCLEEQPRRGIERVFQREMHPASCFTVHPPFPKALHHKFMRARVECTAVQGMEHRFPCSTQRAGGSMEPRFQAVPHFEFVPHALIRKVF